MTDVLSTIFQLYRGSHFYWWRKQECRKKITNLSQVTDELSRNVISRTLVMSGIRTHIKNFFRYYTKNQMKLVYYTRVFIPDGAVIKNS
jgi:predicted phosphohydrolase